MRVNEIFKSIQGEGTLQGVPTIFIRLAGCNLKVACKYCDTMYAFSSAQGTEMLVGDLVAEVEKLPTKKGQWICITGGEPLAQKEELFSLVRTLKSRDYLIEIETNGTLDKPFWWPLVDSWNVDIKCPSSGILGRIDAWTYLRDCDQIKFVVGTEEDLVFVYSLLKYVAFSDATIEVSPVIPTKGYNLDLVDFNRKWLQRVAEFSVDHNLRYSLQIHKVIWGTKKGV